MTALSCKFCVSGAIFILYATSICMSKFKKGGEDTYTSLCINHERTFMEMCRQALSLLPCVLKNICFLFLHRNMLSISY